jgi:hypothetical protein
MRALLLGMVACAALQAQSPVALYMTSSTGNTTTPFPSTYTFSDTPVGSSISVGVRVVNTTSSAVQISSLSFEQADGLHANVNFATTPFGGTVLAPNGYVSLTLIFQPTQTGATSATVRVGVSTGTGSSLVNLATVQGNGTSALLTLSCTASTSPLCTGQPLPADEASAISFGIVSVGSSQTMTFTISNGGTDSINPQSLVSLLLPSNNPQTTFSVSNLPSTIAPQSTGTFIVTFTPQDTNPQAVTLVMGQSQYRLQGFGTASVLGDISSLQITYTDSTGVTLPAQSTPIDFGPLITGTGASATLTFTLKNPSTTINPVPVNFLTISGTGFKIVSDPTPVTIAPGTSATFQVTFTESGSGKYTGSLSIGGRTFSLAGESVASSLPTPSISVDAQPLLSGQQPHVTVQLAAGAPVQEIGTLSMQFTPSISSSTDDAAVEFVSPGSRQLQVSVASGAQAATYNGQSAITFQTGTTAGTIKFTVQFPNQPAVTQSYTVTPAQIQITSAQAVRQAPNLVLTVVGFDNTHTAGPLSFLFYDLSGKALMPTAISYDATNAFQQNVFQNGKNPGGTFSLQASFPVTGDVTQVGSVAVTMKNSAGQASTTQTFQ